MHSTDLQVIKEIPGYKVILKAVLKSQIQYLVEQLVDHTGEESVILTASVSDGSLSHLGSDAGKVFLEDHDDIKSQFLEFCSKREYHHKQKEQQQEQQQEQQLDDPGGPMLMAPNPHGYRPVPNPRFAPSHVPTTTRQILPHSQISPHSASPSSVHPVSLTRASPQSGPRGANVRHEPYPGARPKKTNFNSRSYKRLSQPSNSTSLPVDPDDALKDNQNPIIKTEPIDNYESAENSTGGSDSHSPAVQDAESESSSSTIINESSEVKFSDMLPSGGLGVDSDLSNHSGEIDSSISENTVADPKKVKVEANTDLEAGQMTKPDNGSMPNIQTRMDYDPSTSGGTQGGVGDQSSQGYRNPIFLYNGSIMDATYYNRACVPQASMEDNRRIYRNKVVWECDFCQRQFHKEFELVNHRRVHTGDKDKSYRCKTCQERFKTRCHMTYHAKRARHPCE